MCIICECAFGLIKWLMIFLNFLFFVAGGVVLGVTIWLAVDETAGNDLTVHTSPYWDVAVYVLMGVGALIFLLGFLGCAGMCCKSSCMLYLYMFLVYLCIIGEVVVVVLVAVYGVDIKNYSQRNMEDEIKLYHTGDADLDTNWDLMQMNRKCCGASDYTNWIGTPFEIDTNKPVPESCCVDNGEDDFLARCYTQASVLVPPHPEDTTNLYVHGCSPKTIDWFDSSSWIIYIVVIVVFCVQVVGLFIALCMNRAMNKNSNSVNSNIV